MSVLSFLFAPIQLLISNTISNEASAEQSREMEHTAHGKQLSEFTTWTGNLGHHWLDLGNWSNGLPSANHHAYIPQQPIGNHFPIVTNHCQIDYTIRNEGVICNEGEFNILKDGFLQNYGVLENGENAKLVNYGNLINHGTLVNHGYLENQHVLVNGQVIKNEGSILGENQIVQLDEVYASGILENANENIFQTNRVSS